jgi:2-C-methyl-D-erythritol 4-phosphate cytidylyltransferase
LIVAAGRGERLGSGRPKALVTLGGKPLLQWSVDALREVEAVSTIVIALPPEAVSEAPPGTIGVAGGAVRSESVRNALAAAGSAANPESAAEPVIVHDAARPLATSALFSRALAELESSGADAVIAASPVSDTIKEIGTDGATVSRTLERSRLWAVQTPQVFRRAALEAALRSASDELLAAATDDAWLIERAGGTVRVLDAGPRNLKVTTPTDLRLAEMLLSDWA